MTLSQIENEDAIDVLANIIEPVAEIAGDKEIQAAYRSKKPPIMLVKAMLKNHKRAVVEIISALHCESPDTYRFTIISLTQDLLDILNDQAMKEVFTQQSQIVGGNASGSAMGNTEEESH